SRSETPGRPASPADGPSTGCGPPITWRWWWTSAPRGPTRTARARGGGRGEGCGC
ncbi:MAG: hypothetical protein GWN79_20505, partial [Actinobacteria bacterium]|nr:hypothetical protein [Actinomycetota bacterium]NIS29193.1 hypothetical protein [Actinomycetota bacterium]NIT97651.1 hypothetical protein [Actinomycetota bacterium]NIU21303.1 hypothetical protein [Actinomycetota bacterium]NIU64594.1 hypothetical protein [Actinomycetota bacterium]